MPDPKIVLGIPVERNGVPNDDCFWSFMSIAQQGWAMIHTEYGATDVVRNMICQFLLDHAEFSHVVMLDADHTHPPDTVRRLARDVRDHPEMLVVGGLHYRRGAPYDPQAYIMDEATGKVFAYIDETPAQIMQVARIGMGSTIIHRSVVERLAPPWFKYEYPANVENHRRPSEDIYFSRLCCEAGITLWCDTTLTSPHLRKSYIDKATFLEYIRSHPNEVKVSSDPLAVDQVKGW